MKNLTNFSCPQFGQIRTAGTSDNPLFCLADICKALDLHPSVVRQRLSDDVCSTYPIVDALGREQQTNFVNEDGLYDVILDSRKPEAKKFRKWVTGEVLPAIRKTGVYAAKPRKFIAPRRRDVQRGQFYDDLTLLVTHEDEREIAGRFEVSRSFVHDVLRGQKAGYRVLEALVARAKENRRNGVERVVPFIASAALYEQLVLDFYTEEA